MVECSKRRNSIEKVRGACQKFWKKKPWEVPLRSCFTGMASMFFSPLKGTNSKTTHYILSYCFSTFHKGTAKASAADFLTLRGNKTTKKVQLDSTPVLLVWESTCPWKFQLFCLCTLSLIYFFHINAGGRQRISLMKWGCQKNSSTKKLSCSKNK